MGRAFGVLGSRHMFRRRAVAVRASLRGPGRSLRRAEWSFRKGASGSRGTLGHVGSCWQASLTWSPGGPEAPHSHKLPGEAGPPWMLETVGAGLGTGGMGEHACSVSKEK